MCSDEQIQSNDLTDKQKRDQITNKGNARVFQDLINDAKDNERNT